MEPVKIILSKSGNMVAIKLGAVGIRLTPKEAKALGEAVYKMGCDQTEKMARESK